MRKQIWCAAALAFLLLSSLYGQSGNAIVVGQVTDSTGAVVPGANISIQNTATNVVQQTKSNSDGRYSVPGLIPGQYQLTTVVDGFKKFERRNIVLQVGDHVAIDVVLELGSSAESVTVTAEVPLLRTEDAQAGLVIDHRRIMELPQYGRNPLAFAQLAPNVNGSSDQGAHGSDFRVNGGRTNQTEYVLDGQAVTTGFLHNVPPSVPSKEAVAEFKVVTNGLSAEYGRLSGGAVIMATRSGTNEFHGSLYEFFKNDKLNANTWNGNRRRQNRAVFHENVFGFTFGGPVLIPKVYRGKDRTFFFLNYEGGRYKSGSNTLEGSVPTLLERQGDFSQSLIDNSQPVRIYDPESARVVNGTIVRDPFPQNRIPADRVDPLAKIYLGYYPDANQAPRAGTTSEANYLYGRSTPSTENRWTSRLDQNWSSKHVTHFSLVEYDYVSDTPRAFSALEAVGVNSTNSYTAIVEHNWTMSPTTIWTFRLGAVRNRTYTGRAVNADASGWGLSGNVLNLLGGANQGRVPEIINAGYTTLGGGTIDDTRDTSYSASVNVQKMWGKHTVKAGYEHRRYYTNETFGGDFSMQANRKSTAITPDDGSTGAYMAGFLLGTITSGGGNQLAGPASLQTYHALYLQDDIKVNKKVTLNLGLRWDFEPPRTERFDRQVFWDRNYTWNWQPNSTWNWSQVEQAIGQTLAQPEWMTKGIHGRAARMGTAEYPMRTLEESHYRNFGPRVGIAYQIMRQTVIRSSYSLLYLTKTGNWFLSSARWNTGYGDMARLAEGGTPDGGLTYPIRFSNPMPNNAGYVPLTTDVNALNLSVMGNWWLSQTSKYNSGHEHNVQLAIQREIGSGANSWVVEVAYNGSMGRGLPAWIGNGEHILPDAYHKIGGLGSKLLQSVPNPFYGQIPAGSSRAGEVLPLGNLYELNPLWQQISTTGDPDGTSNYNSAYVQVEHRFAGGFSFLANYTLGKLMEDTGGIDHYGAGSGRFTQAGLGRKDVYSLSDTDYRHKIVLNYSLDLPFGRGKKFLNRPQGAGAKVLDNVVGGWTAAGTSTFRCGRFLQISGSDSLWWNAGQASTDVSERPVWVSRDLNPSDSGHSSLEGSAGYTPYMNRAAFRKAQARDNILEIGDVGWTLPQLRGPAFSQWDFSLMKNFGLGSESRYFQLRFEAQNLFNHMNSRNPNTDITSANFGKITNQNGNPRVAMIAAKFYF